jgi:amidophosphoribosyltransferase
MCAVFGIYSSSLDNSHITAKGLFSLQHRGQESSGITTSDGKKIYSHRKTGLVSQVYDEEILNSLVGNIAIGHNRYATYSKRTAKDHLQPVIDKATRFTLAHNGNLPDTTKIESFLNKHGIKTENINDTEMMHAAILYYIKKGASLDSAIMDAVPLFTGAFSLLAMDRNKIVAIRDKNGIRPLSIGSLNGGYVFSSETCALDTVGARFIRAVAPGEMVIADENGLQSVEFAKNEQKLDIFEFVYFSRPDSVLMGKSVYQARRNFGKILAKEHPIKGDIVIAVPDSGTPAAIGYSQVSGIPFEEGLIKNRYIGRTFITPGQDKRSEDVSLKLNPLPDVLRGQRVIVVDDSIVRGTTSKRLVKRIRDAGAREVHLVITSPPVKFPDFYGIDTPSQKELIGANKTVEEIRRFISSDSLSFLSLEGMIEATGLPREVFSTSCFTGEYPIDIGRRKREISY